MLAVRSPEYWPRLAYVALASRVDRFVIADTFQYSRQSYQNRSRLRTPHGSMWVTLPLEGGQHGRPASEIVIETRERWAVKHWRALEFNYRSAPYFEYYEDEIRTLLEQPWHGLADLTSATVLMTFRLFAVSTPVVRATELNGSPTTMEAILQACKDDRLLTLPESVRRDRNTVPATDVLHFEERERRQNFPGFLAGMSALDALFSYGPDAVQFLKD